MMKKITLAYIPVLHSGYVAFLKANQHPVYLIGKDLISELAKDIPYYGRDIRALDDLEMKQVIESLDIVPSVAIANKKTLATLNVPSIEILSPDEDISREVITRHLKKANIKYENIFLRWDKRITEKEFEVSPHRKISTEVFDREVIGKAMAEAQKSSDWWRQVGALAVKGKKILFIHHNKHLPSPYNPYSLGDPRTNFEAGKSIELSTALHAEAAIVAEAAEKGVSLKGTSVYVTTFPCPVCAKLIAAAGVSRVYYKNGYSLLDAEKLFNIFGIEIILVT